MSGRWLNDPTAADFGLRVTAGRDSRQAAVPQRPFCAGERSLRNRPWHITLTASEPSASRHGLAHTGDQYGPHASPAFGYGISPGVFLPPRKDEEGPTMGAGDKARHAAEKAKGKAEEAVGKTTDNPTRTGKGQRKQTKADLKQAGEKTKDAFKK